MATTVPELPCVVLVLEVEWNPSDFPVSAFRVYPGLFRFFLLSCMVQHRTGTVLLMERNNGKHDQIREYCTVQYWYLMGADAGLCWAPGLEIMRRTDHHEQGRSSCTFTAFTKLYTNLCPALYHLCSLVETPNKCTIIRDVSDHKRCA